MFVAHVGGDGTTTVRAGEDALVPQALAAATCSVQLSVGTGTLRRRPAIGRLPVKMALETSRT